MLIVKSEKIFTKIIFHWLKSLFLFMIFMDGFNLSAFFYQSYLISWNGTETILTGFILMRLFGMWWSMVSFQYLYFNILNFLMGGWVLIFFNGVQISLAGSSYPWSLSSRRVDIKSRGWGGEDDPWKIKERDLVRCSGGRVVIYKTYQGEVTYWDVNPRGSLQQ